MFRHLLLATAVATASLLPIAAWSKDAALLAAAAAEQSAVLDTLKTLVEIETGSGDAVGIPQMVDLLETRLKALGADVVRHAPADGSPGHNLVGTLTGSGSGTILLMVHMDTVYARGKLATAPFRIEGNLAYGPGIADAKGGVAVILHALKLLKDLGFRDYGRLVVLFNTDEEKGSRGSLALIQAEAAKADYVLSFEPTLGSQESLIRATSGIAQARVQVTGRSAHAGAAPETGVNALVEASDIVLRTLDLDQGQGKLRFNWTVGGGGELANVIPETATISANIRYLNEPMLEQLVSDLEARLAKKRLPEARVALTLERGRPPFNANAGGLALINRAVAIYAEIGHTLTVVPVTGGGTDAAYAALSGKPVIESLGLPGFGYHSNNAEYVLIDAIPRRLYLTAEMIRQLAAKPS